MRLLELGLGLPHGRFIARHHALSQSRAAHLGGTAKPFGFLLRHARGFDRRGQLPLRLFLGTALSLSLEAQALNARLDLLLATASAQILELFFKLGFWIVGCRATSIFFGGVVLLDDLKGIGVNVVEIDLDFIREIVVAHKDGLASVAVRRAETFAGHQRPPTFAPLGTVAVISSSDNIRNSTPSMVKRLPA